MSIHIVIANHQEVVKIGLTYIIRRWMPEAIVSCALNMQELTDLLRNQSIDILIMDININGGNNLKLIRRIKNIQSAMKILILTEYKESQHAPRCLEAGADGYLPMACREGDVEIALDTLLNGEKYLSNTHKEN